MCLCLCRRDDIVVVSHNGVQMRARAREFPKGFVCRANVQLMGLFAVLIDVVMCFCV